MGKFSILQAISEGKPMLMVVRKACKDLMFALLLARTNF